MSYQERLTTRMSEAVSAGKYVVIKPTFQTIPDTHTPNIRNVKQSAGLVDVFGVAAAQWEQDHYDQFVTFHVGSTEKLVDILAILKAEALSIGLNGRQVSERLKISKDRVLSPWGSFYPDDRSDKSKPTKRSDDPMHMTEVFDALYKSATRQSERSRVPGLAPILRKDLTVSIPQTEKLTRNDHLLTGARWHTEIDGNHAMQEDLLRVPDKILRERMIAAEKFSFVATPFLERWNLASVLHDKKTYPLAMIWHIADERQVLFEGDGTRDVPSELQHEERPKPVSKQPKIDDRQFTLPI